MEETTAAWLAALIDGEGSVMLNRRTYSESWKKKRPTLGKTLTAKNRFRPVVVIAAGTDVRLFDAIREKIGVGQVYTHRISNTAKSHNPRARIQYTYRLNVKQITEILPDVLPWLVLKKPQAELLLEAIEWNRKRNSTGGYPGFNDPEFREESYNRLNEIYSSIRALNTKGRITEEEFQKELKNHVSAH